MDYSLPGSSIYGIFQARVLDWGAIAFSGWSEQVSSNLVPPLIGWVTLSAGAATFAGLRFSPRNESIWTMQPFQPQLWGC